MYRWYMHMHMLQCVLHVLYMQEHMCNVYCIYLSAVPMLPKSSSLVRELNDKDLVAAYMSQLREYA